MLKTIFDRLVIFRENASSPFVSKIVRYHPDRPYLEKYNYDVSHLHLYGLEDYTGYLEYLTPTGSRTGIVRVVDGRPVRRHAVPNSQVLARRVSSKGMTTMSGGEWVCNDVCEPAYGTICIGGTGDPDYPGDETCYDDVIGENCYPDCEWVENPEEPVEPDFCDLPENWEICYGGGEPGEPEETQNKENNPCDGVTKANALKNKVSVSSEINVIKNSSSETGYKFYVLDNSDYNTFYVGNGVVNGSSSNWATNFTWDSNTNGGYTIGHMHNHPAGSAPSPSDAMAGVDLDQMQSMPNISTGEVDFYTKNFSAIIVTSSYVYTITIKDAALYKTFQAGFDNSTANTTYLNHAYTYKTNYNSSDEEAGEYALLKMYGNAINLTRQGVNSSDSNVELKLNSSDTVVSNNPCSP